MIIGVSKRMTYSTEGKRMSTWVEQIENVNPRTVDDDGTCAGVEGF